MTALSLLELTLFVHDVDRCAEFYEAIGIAMFENPEPGCTRHFDGGVGHTAVQLFPASQKYPATHVQLGFRVTDIAAAVRRLDALGCEWDCTHPDFVSTRDPGGNRVNLRQECR